MYILLLAILAVIIFIVLWLLLINYPKVYYYDYENSESTQIGDFSVDQVVTSDRYINLYSDKALTKRVGYGLTHGTYTRLENDTLYSLRSIIQLDTNQFIKIGGWARYAGFEKVTIEDKVKVYITSSNIGRLYNPVTISKEGNIYKMTIL